LRDLRLAAQRPPERLGKRSLVPLCGIRISPGGSDAAKTARRTDPSLCFGDLGSGLRRPLSASKIDPSATFGISLGGSDAAKTARNRSLAVLRDLGSGLGRPLNASKIDPSANVRDLAWRLGRRQNGLGNRSLAVLRDLGSGLGRPLNAST
jgi:hypothetical protein